MKKIIALAVTLLWILTAVPAFAESSGNGSLRADAARIINQCREMMKGAVNAGDMTKDQLKACIDMMKVSPCVNQMDQ